MSQTTLPVEQRTRCTAPTNSGAQCTRWAHAGETLCRQHAGLALPREPTGLSFDDQEAIFEALRDGMTLDGAIVEAKVNRSTVYRWLELAREEGTHPVYREFEAGVTAARTHLERQTLKQLQVAAKKGSVPAMRTILQRISPAAAGGGQLRFPTRSKRGADLDDDAPDNVIPLKPTAGDADW